MGFPTSVRVVSNTAGFGLGEYVGPLSVSLFNVSGTCEIQNFFFVSKTEGISGLATGSLSMRSIDPATTPDGHDLCAGLSVFDDEVRRLCLCAAKLTFKYNP